MLQVNEANMLGKRRWLPFKIQQHGLLQSFLLTTQEALAYFKCCSRWKTVLRIGSRNCRRVVHPASRARHREGQIRLKVWSWLKLCLPRQQAKHLVMSFARFPSRRLRVESQVCQDDCSFEEESQDARTSKERQWSM